MAPAVAGVDKHTVARSNVFILGQMLKGEADRQVHQQNSKPGAPVIALTKATDTENGAHGLPVRQLLTAMYHVERHKRLGEVFVFALFFAVFLTIVFQLYDVGVAYRSNAALEDLLLDEEIPGAPFKKNFYEIMTQAEIFDWLEGPLLSGMYPTESYTERQLSKVEQQYVLSYFRLVGGVRLRQARVTNTSCDQRRYLSECQGGTDIFGRTSRPNTACIGRFDNLDGTCFAEFRAPGSVASVTEDATEDRSPMVRNGHVYEWSSGMSLLDGLYGWFQSYGTGGYVTQLPSNATEAARLVHQLREDEWLDRGSRALEVAMNLFNTNTGLVTVVRIVFEMFPSGMIIKWARIYSVPALPYRSVQDQLRLVAEVVFVIFIAYYIQKACRRLRRDSAGGVLRASLQPNTVFELVLCALAIVTIVQWFRFVTAPQIAGFDVNGGQFEDLYDVGESFVLTLSWAGMVGLGASFRLFQFLSISKRMNTMWLTIRHGAVDVLAFGVSFAIVIFGFALWGEMSFGAFLTDFRTFFGSISTLARFTLGSWNYEDLRMARPAFAGVFFSLYSALLTISLVNMIIGIIETSFSEVLDEVETADRWKENATPVEASCVHRSRVGCSICCRRVCGHGLMRGDADIRAEAVIAARDRFHSALHACLRKAHREGTDLFSHLDKIYDENKKNDALYISWHELASLLYRDQLFSPSYLHFRGNGRTEGGLRSIAGPAAKSGTPARAAVASATGAAASSPAAGSSSSSSAAAAATNPAARRQSTSTHAKGVMKAAALLGGAAAVAAQQQQTARQLAAVRAAESRMSLEMLLAQLENEVQDQHMSRADASVINDHDELDNPDEECGPCLWRVCCRLCSTGRQSHGRAARCFPCLEVFCRGGEVSRRSGGGTAATGRRRGGGRRARNGASTSSSSSSSSGSSAARASTTGAATAAERDRWRELRMLVKTYISLQRVHFVSAARRHTRAKEEQDAREKAATRVFKRTNGLEYVRKLVVDDRRGELLSFDTHDNLRRRLPFSQLVAVERSATQERAIALVFTSQGVPPSHANRSRSMEVVFDIRFASDADLRRFYNELREAAAKFHEKLLIMSRLMVERPAEAAMMLARQGVEQAHAKVTAVASRARSASRLVQQARPTQESTKPKGGMKATMRRVMTAQSVLKRFAAGSSSAASGDAAASSDAVSPAVAAATGALRGFVRNRRAQQQQQQQGSSASAADDGGGGVGMTRAVKPPPPPPPSQSSASTDAKQAPPRPNLFG